jgi:hypothetical protein
LITECCKLEDYRNTRKLQNNQTIRETLDEYETSGFTTNDFKSRMFLGQEPNLKKIDFIERGIILQELHDLFMSKWSDLSGVHLTIL